MSPRQPPGCAGPGTRGRATHWRAASPLTAAIGLLLACLVTTWAASTPARALPRSGFDPGLAVQRDHAPGHLPRQLEADLPDLVDTVHPVGFDSDAAAPRSFALAPVVVAALRDGLRLPAVCAPPPRSFDPRAPPGLR